MIKVKDAELD
jgi:uncharacterized coiled-coil DUF342 family protein